MAAAKAFRAKSFSFKTTALSGVTDVSVEESGSEHILSTDGSHGADAVFVDGIAARMTVTTTDVAGASAWIPGDTGAAVAVKEIRAEGSGAGTGNKTATAAQATFISRSSNHQTTGIGSTTITFSCSIPSAATAAIAWS